MTGSLDLKATLFLSTPSARRATCELVRCHVLFFISIHALREEGDTGFLSVNGLIGLFLSTPSARRATFSSSLSSLFPVISIHALREEGDYGISINP